MSSNIKLFKLDLVHSFLSESTSLKHQLLDELVIYATDPIIRTRRMRMLAQLCDYEAQILKKIENFQTDDPSDLNIHIFNSEIYHVCDRSA
jgi:hypothetical protein